MRPLGPSGARAAPRIALAAVLALVLSSGAASAMCTGTAGVNILASDGETCNAIGPYSSTAVPAGQATGTGSVLTWPGGGSVSFSTSAANTPAVQADTGGSVILNVTAPYAGTVTTTGAGSNGLYATGAASSISVTNFAISTQNLGDYSTPIYATQGGQITVNGGSATSVGASSPGAAVVGGGTINLNGTTILASGDGSAGIVINGAGGVINATGVNITTHGNVDTSLGNYADGAYNGSYGATYPSGGTMTITNSTITTTGTDANGVVTNSGGVTNINGGSITTTGNGALGLEASGAGSSISTSNGKSRLFAGMKPHFPKLNGIRYS